MLKSQAVDNVLIQPIHPRNMTEHSLANLPCVGGGER